MARQGPPPDRNMAINFTYNIHYPTDQSSEAYLADIAAYGDDYCRSINRRTLEICENKMSSSCIDWDYERFLIENVSLTVEGRYYKGSTGIPSTVKYSPDARYTQIYRKRSNHQISLSRLHENSPLARGSGTDGCKHVMIVGNQGCGKTVLCKRYAEMVLHRQVRELADVEVIHYIDMNHIRNNGKHSIPMLIFESFIDENETKNRYSWEWIKQNPEKFLFIFDHADKYIGQFKEDGFPMGYNEEMEPHELLQNTLRGRLFPGCFTLIGTREWPLHGLHHGCRPDKLVLVGPMDKEKRLHLLKSAFPSESAGEQCFKIFTRKFPISFSMTTDPLMLYFAMSSYKHCENDRSRTSFTDTMLLSMIAQHIPRSYHTSMQFSQIMSKLYLIAFDMISKGQIAGRRLELDRYENLKYEDVKDAIVVAPEHKCLITHRLLPSDYCYFFAHIAFMELMAACHITNMSTTNFKEFFEQHLHTSRWRIVRRLLCGITVNKDARKYLASGPVRPSPHQGTLLTSLKTELAGFNTMPTDSKFELLACLHECGDSAKDILQQLSVLHLDDRVLDAPDLYIITRIAEHVPSFRSVRLSLCDDICLEEYDLLISAVLQKSLEICIDLTRLELRSAHANGLERLGRGQLTEQREVRIIVPVNTSEHVMRILRNLEGIRSGQTKYSINHL